MKANHNTRRKSKSGFTLVELMIVVVVIGIIAGGLIVKFNGKTDKALTTMNLSNLRALDLACEAYIAEGLTIPAVGASGWQTTAGAWTNGWMTATERTNLVTSLAQAGKITVEGTAADEAARFRAYRTANGGGTAPVSITIMQYRKNTTDPYVVNGNKTCQAAFADTAMNAITTATGGSDYATLTGGTATAWATATQ